MSARRASGPSRTPLPRYRLVRGTGASAAAAVTLDRAQRDVVSHRAGPLLVVGGPGTGKTTTLVEAVAARVAEGVDPAQILVLTFGRRASATLREQIEARVGASLDGGARRRTTMAEPVVRTFPAYAFGLLRLAAAQRGEPAPRLLTGAEQDAVIREMLTTPAAADRWPPGLRKAVRTRAFAAQLRDVLLRAAERGIGPGRLAELGREQGRADWVAAAGFLAEYQQVLALRDATTRGSAAYDQAELVRSAQQLLREDPELLAAERGRYRHVYLDELADTDPAQLELLQLVAGGGAHVVGFADPDSATFAFRGGDPTGVRDFAQRFTTAAGPSAPQVTLDACYRSTVELVEATRRVAARLRGPVHHRALRVVAPAATEPAVSTVDVCTLRSATSESAYVAQRLREAHLQGGIPWSRMAVVVRSLRHHHAALRRALTQAGVPVTTGSEDTALATQPAIAPFLTLIRCALGMSSLDEGTAVDLLHSPLGGADPFGERRLRQSLRANNPTRPSGELLVEALRQPGLLALVDQRWVRPARSVASLIAVARTAAARPAATAEDVLWEVWQASGLADRWAAASARGGRRGATADRDLDAVLVLFDAAARFTDRLPGARIELFLDYLAEQQLPTDTLAPTAERGEAVRLLTAHAAKGLEWDVVVVAGVQEGAWPDLRLRGSVLGSERLVDVVAQRELPEGRANAATQVAALLDEERRLFYVAVTRARRHLVVTAVDPSGTGSGGDEQPSRFLAELVSIPAEPRRGEGRAAGSAAAQHHSAAEPRSGEGRAASSAAAQHHSAAVRPAEAVARDELDAAEEAREVPSGLLRRPITLPALVAELRLAVTDPASPDALRAAAAEQLARLAAAGVPGADPDEWWGLRPVSDGRPLVGAGERVGVSPSTVETSLRCGLKWLLERHGGNNPPTAKQGIGNLVHAAAMLLAEATAAQAAPAVRSFVDERFDLIELEARWLRQKERDRAERMVDKLLSWLTANPRQPVGVEQQFDVSLAPDDSSAGREVVIRGRVDRLERDAKGRLVVVDLKTGASAPTEADVAQHPQLAAYQVSVEAGAFGSGEISGGAEIVAVGTTSAGPVVRTQDPLQDSADPGWAEQLVRRAAATMAASTFRAVLNDSCQYCPVRTSCPVSGKGRQVPS